jgi:hypothetical protein
MGDGLKVTGLICSLIPLLYVFISTSSYISTVLTFCLVTLTPFPWPISTKLILLALLLISVISFLLFRLRHALWSDAPSLFAFPVWREFGESCVRLLVDPNADPRPRRRQSKDEMAVPNADMLSMGRSVGRQTAISATLVSTIVQKRP